MTKTLKDKSKSGRKKIDVRGVGLFDHVKHIQSIQDPNYFKNLTNVDVKSFNHFMILKALSMNPLLLEDISTLFKYFDKIPSPQLYKLLINIIPLDKKFYPWVKAKKLPYSNELLELVVRYFEISKKEAVEYVTMLCSNEKGRKELEQLCEDFGLNEREIKELFENKGEES